MTTWLPATLIGAVLGYGIIYLRETGWLLAAIVTVGLAIVYWRQDRHRDIGLLMAFEGIWPTFVAGWGLYQEATRTDTEVGTEMWLVLGVGMSLMVLGAGIVGSSFFPDEAPR